MNWGNKSAISIAGGKGGIGKSSFTTNLGVVLSQQGKRVVLVDADIGAANLHTMVGVSYPKKTLADFFRSTDVELEDVLVDTPYPGLRLLSTASDILAIVSPNYKMNQRLFRAFQRLDTDVIVFDIAAGTHHRAIDFFALAPVGIVIVEPIPTALENAFLFTKNLLFRFLLRMFYHDVEMKRFIQSSLQPKEESKLLQFGELLEQIEGRAPDKIRQLREYFSADKFKMCIVGNCVRNPAQQQVFDRFAKIVKRYLGLSPRIVGYLPYEERMDIAITHRTPLVVKYPQSPYLGAMQDIVQSLPLK